MVKMRFRTAVFLFVLMVLMVLWVFYGFEGWSLQRRCEGCLRVEQAGMVRLRGTVSVGESGVLFFKDMEQKRVYRLAECGANCKNWLYEWFLNVGLRDVSTNNFYLFDIEGDRVDKEGVFYVNNVVLVDY